MDEEPILYHKVRLKKFAKEEAAKLNPRITRFSVDFMEEINEVIKTYIRQRLVYDNNNSKTI